MKVITTGLLNRFWTKGIKPWLDKRIKSYADLMVTTASGYTPDALAVKEGFTEVNSKLEWTVLATSIQPATWYWHDITQYEEINAIVELSDAANYSTINIPVIYITETVRYFRNDDIKIAIMKSGIQLISGGVAMAIIAR